MAQKQSKFSGPDYQVLGKCPVCKAFLYSKQSALVERRRQGALFHVDCDRCKSSVLLMVVQGPMHFLTTVGMLTDISKPDVERMSRQERINADDVLTLYSHFKKHSNIKV